MIDKLLRADLIEKEPWYGIVLGFLFASLGIIFSYLIFKTSPSFPAVFLTTLAAAPILAKVLKGEKRKGNILKRHEKVINAYFYMFFGMTMAFASFSAFLPQDMSNSIFSEQLSNFSGGYFTMQSNLFIGIVLNNFGLVLFFFLLSLFYGSGSIFLLAWNSSILGVMWGGMLRATLSLMDPAIFLKNVFFIFPFLLPEVEAYFLASIAGGIVSVNLYNSKKLEIEMKDSLIFLMLASMLIIVAGLIETFLIA